MEDVSPKLNHCRITHGNMVMTIRASGSESQSAARRWLRGLVCCCLVVASFGLGCTTTNSFLAVDATLQPANVPCRAIAVWVPKVHFEPDPTHGGQPVPRIAGRSYLF